MPGKCKLLQVNCGEVLSPSRTSCSQFVFHLFQVYTVHFCICFLFTCFSVVCKVCFNMKRNYSPLTGPSSKYWLFINMHVSNCARAAVLNFQGLEGEIIAHIPPWLLGLLIYKGILTNKEARSILGAQGRDFRCVSALNLCDRFSLCRTEYFLFPSSRRLVQQ